MSLASLAQILEAALVWFAFQVLRLLPLDTASAFGGWIGRNVGYPLPVTQRARRNLDRIMPNLDSGRREDILRRMWDNLGRNAGEFPHLSEFRFGPGECVEVKGEEHLGAEDISRTGCLMFSAHLANWELGRFGAAAKGYRMHNFYRASNNPFLDSLYRHGRATDGSELLPKGSQGARRALALLRQCEIIGLLVDQKMNDGIPVPFFGIDAMTAPALAELALRFKCPVFPVRVIRLGGAHFRIEVEPALKIHPTGDRHADVKAIMIEVNSILERWIGEYPEQWLWLHRRWPG